MIDHIAIAKELCQNGIPVPSSIILPIVERAEQLERLSLNLIRMIDDTGSMSAAERLELVATSLTEALR